VEKRYLALVRGIPPEHGVIDYAIPRKPGGERVPAVTEVRRLAVYGRYSLVGVHGRTLEVTDGEAVLRDGDTSETFAEDDPLEALRRVLPHRSPAVGDPAEPGGVVRRGARDSRRHRRGHAVGRDADREVSPRAVQGDGPD
jgi:hypothetical protein